MNPKNIRARIALSVNGAVIHVVHPVVDRAMVERGKIIPRQNVLRRESRVTDKGSVGGAPTHFQREYLLSTRTKPTPIIVAPDRVPASRIYPKTGADTKDRTIMNVPIKGK
jgi:hypothetical protein